MMFLRCCTFDVGITIQKERLDRKPFFCYIYTHKLFFYIKRRGAKVLTVYWTIGLVFAFFLMISLVFESGHYITVGETIIPPAILAIIAGVIMYAILWLISCFGIVESTQEKTLTQIVEITALADTGVQNGITGIVFLGSGTVSGGEPTTRYTYCTESSDGLTTPQYIDDTKNDRISVGWKYDREPNQPKTLEIIWQQSIVYYKKSKWLLDPPKSEWHDTGEIRYIFHIPKNSYRPGFKVDLQ